MSVRLCLDSLQQEIGLAFLAWLVPDSRPVAPCFTVAGRYP